ncbi:MAG: hypothetical protein OEZ34_15610 [Spirochaetia bacterium]|nr:hypothetical protein [Spirochaetia bacterium]
MEFGLVNQYKRYKEQNDEESGEVFAHHLYRVLSSWIENGVEDSSFVDEFWELFGSIDGGSLSGTDLIDLGILQTAEALSFYKENDRSKNNNFYLTEARLPFFAFIEEKTYRLIKNIEFTEIDFQIFEIIGGTFPHDAAQNFLMKNEWADIWLTLRYLDSLEDIDLRIEILEKVLNIRNTLPEKLLFLAYLYLIDSSYILNAFSKEPVSKSITLPPDITEEIAADIYQVIMPFLETGTLDTSWETRMSEKMERETVFVLLALFEISQCPLNPGWIAVLERGVSVFWNESIYSGHGKYIPQPIQEFAASILGLFPDEEAESLLETSRILILFMENLHLYSEESFYDLLTPLTRFEEFFYEELEFQLHRHRYDSLQKKRYIRRIKICAERIGYTLTIVNGRPVLSRQEKF